jgi:hypothetical protein
MATYSNSHMDIKDSARWMEKMAPVFTSNHVVKLIAIFYDQQQHGLEEKGSNFSLVAT